MFTDPEVFYLMDGIMQMFGVVKYTIAKLNITMTITDIVMDIVKY